MKKLGYLALGWDMIAIGVFSLAVLYCAIAGALPREKVDVCYERIKGAAIMLEEIGEA